MSMDAIEKDDLSSGWAAPSESPMFISSGTDLDHDVERRHLFPRYRDPGIAFIFCVQAHVLPVLRGRS
jgi:hypothetical protein